MYVLTVSNPENPPRIFFKFVTHKVLLAAFYKITRQPQSGTTIAHLPRQLTMTNSWTEVDMNIKVLATLGAILVFGSTSCAPQMSRPVTERERTAMWGGLAGGAGGAVIGSMAGSALAGGLFGIPLGAAAGWYYGDQLALAQERDRTRMEERDAELDRLRRENERLRRETDDIRRPSTSQAPASSSAERAASSSQSTTTSPSTTGDQAVSRRQASEESVSRQASGQGISRGQVASYTQPDQIRQAQMELNKRGFNAGPQDGVWGPETESAIREFQRSRGLEVTGRLNDRTMKELGVAERSSEQRTTSERRSN